MTIWQWWWGWQTRKSFVKLWSWKKSVISGYTISADAIEKECLWTALKSFWIHFMISVLRGFGFFRSWKNASGDVVVEQSIGSTTHSMLKNGLHTNPLSYIHYSRRRSEHWNLYELKTCAACRQQKTLGQCGHVFVRIGTQWEGKRFFDHTSKRLLNGRIHLVDTNHFYADLYFIGELQLCTVWYIVS